MMNGTSKTNKQKRPGQLQPAGACLTSHQRERPMKRLQSDMTPADLEAWRQRHGHSLSTGAEGLGISRSLFARYLAGELAIPQTVALLTVMLDRLAARKKQR